MHSSPTKGPWWPRRRSTTAQLRRGRPPKTSQDDVLAAALRIADVEGLAALSIRRLADDLGVAPMTLYNYVRTKEDILDRLGEVALGSLDVGPGPGQSWEETVFTAMTGVHAALRSHPCGIELIGSAQPIMGPAVDRLRNQLMATLRAAGFGPDNAVNTITVLFSYVIGTATVETTRARRAATLQGHVESLRAEDFPALTADPTAWVHPLPSSVFEHGLRALIGAMPQHDL